MAPESHWSVAGFCHWSQRPGWWGGPGDPELLSRGGGARDPAAEWSPIRGGRGGDEWPRRSRRPGLTPQHDLLLPVLFPMVAPMRASVWAGEAAADRLAAEVAAGRRVVLLCEGDVSLVCQRLLCPAGPAERHPNCPLVG